MLLLMAYSKLFEDLLDIFYVDFPSHVVAHGVLLYVEGGQSQDRVWLQLVVEPVIQHVVHTLKRHNTSHHIPAHT